MIIAPLSALSNRVCDRVDPPQTLVVTENETVGTICKAFLAISRPILPISPAKHTLVKGDNSQAKRSACVSPDAHYVRSPLRSDAPMTTSAYGHTKKLRDLKGPCILGDSEMKVPRRLSFCFHPVSGFVFMCEIDLV